MFATPTSSPQGKPVLAAKSRALRVAKLAGFAFLAMVMMNQHPVVEAQDTTADFFSYSPAMPKLGLPDLDVIPFWTDDLKRAKKAYNSGNFDKAVKFFRKASDDGNIVADWYLGHMYRTGRGVERDDSKAFSYYSRVADTYDPDEKDQNRLRIMVDAQLRVADYYRTGIEASGIPPNYRFAASRYLKIASAYGHPGAQYSLGIMNIKGQGLKKNPQQGLKWLIAAARKRHALSEAYLGDLYWSGMHVSQDKTRGLMWYILARESTDPSEFPDIYDKYEKLNAALPQDARLEAEARARVWAEQYPVTTGSLTE